MQTQYERQAGSLSKSMLMVMALTLVGKVAGFLREMVLANKYSTTYVADALKTAFDLPCFFLSILVMAAAAALIPVYSARKEQSPEQANRFIGNLFTVGLAFSALLLVVTALLLKPIVVNFQLVHATPETQELTIRLARVMLPMGVFVFLARISTAYLHANFSFAVPSLSQIFQNVVIVGAILVSSGTEPTYVALGMTAGWAVQFAVQIPRMRKTGFLYRPSFDLKEPGLRGVAVLMLPVLFSMAFDQFYLWFDRSVASQVVGDISTLDYANRLSTMVGAILLMTIATVLYPSLVRHTHDRDKFAGALSFGVNLNLIISLPATLALALLSQPVTRLVYQRGNFTPADTAATAAILVLYAASIFGIGLRELCNRCFFAFQDTWVPTIVGVGVLLLKIALNYALYPLFDAPGVAAATAVSALISGFALLYLLHKRRQVVDFRRIGRCLWKTLAATGVMSAALLVLPGVLNLESLTGVGFLAAMLVVIATGLFVYGAVLFLLRTEELRLLVGMAKGKLKRP